MSGSPTAWSNDLNWIDDNGDNGVPEPGDTVVFTDDISFQLANHYYDPTQPDGPDSEPFINYNQPFSVAPNVNESDNVTVQIDSTFGGSITVEDG